MLNVKRNAGLLFSRNNGKFMFVLSFCVVSRHIVYISFGHASHETFAGNTKQGYKRTSFIIDFYGCFTVGASGSSYCCFILIILNFGLFVFYIYFRASEISLGTRLYGNFQQPIKSTYLLM